ncbi:MAG: uncharacterized membrane protein YbaN (DUF454 family), partial [Gammaproteobacteria bacterium]
MFEQLRTIHADLPLIAGLLSLLATAIFIDLLLKHVLVRAVRTFAKRSSVTWDDALVSHNVFGRLVQVVPALIVLMVAPLVPDLPEIGVHL